MKPDFIGINYRPCVVDGQEALFHRWVEKEKLYLKFEEVFDQFINNKIVERFRSDQIVPKGTETCTVKNIFGLVEFGDGTVKEVEPEKIRFLDSGNLFREYMFDMYKTERKEDK